MNAKHVDENFMLKEENRKLFKQIKLKDTVFAEKVTSLETNKKDFAAT